MNARDQVLMWAGRLVTWALYAGNNGFGRGFVQGPLQSAELGEKAQQRAVRVLQSFGFRSTPLVNGAESVVVASRAGTSNSIAVVVDNQQVGPTDLKEGESCVYNSKDVDGTKCRVHLDENADVVVNGGSAKVGRVGDACKIKSVALGGHLALWMSQAEGFINATAPGTIVPLSATFLADPGIDIADGAPHFKA